MKIHLSIFFIIQNYCLIHFITTDANTRAPKFLNESTIFLFQVQASKVEDPLTCSSVFSSLGIYCIPLYQFWPADPEEMSGYVVPILCLLVIYNFLISCINHIRHDF